MTQTPRAARRLAMPVSASLVAGVATALTLGSASSAHAADVPLAKSFNYSCAVTAGGLSLGTHAVGIRASTTAPTSVTPGEVLPSRTVNITLTMPELLRSSTVTLLGGVAASGASNDSSVTITTAGKTTSVKIPSLAAARTSIPQNVAPWTIPAVGQVPAITTPTNATGTATLGMPAKFSIVATVYKADNSSNDAALTCTGPADLTLGTIAVVTKAAPKPVVKPTNVKPKFAKKSYAITTKKNKAKSITVKATDANRDKLTYKVAKKSTKGTVTVKKNKVTFKPKKNFTGKTSFQVSVSDGKGGVAKVTVKVTVKKK